MLGGVATFREWGTRAGGLKHSLQHSKKEPTASCGPPGQASSRLSADGAPGWTFEGILTNRNRGRCGHRPRTVYSVNDRLHRLQIRPGTWVTLFQPTASCGPPGQASSPFRRMGYRGNLKRAGIKPAPTANIMKRFPQIKSRA